MHASCVDCGGRGVLILGESGSGKSSLALQLIDAGARLVADDQVTVACEDGALIAAAPPALAGLIEARGVGILTLPYLPRTRLALAVRLVPADSVERLPKPQFWSCVDGRVPLLSLPAYEPSTLAKIRLFLATL